MCRPAFFLALATVCVCYVLSNGTPYYARSDSLHIDICKERT